MTQSRPLPEAHVLRVIADGVESETGDRFFSSLVRSLATQLGVQYALVSEITPERTSFNSIAVFGRGAALPNICVPLAGTPCAGVLNGRILQQPRDLQRLFPDDRGLAEWNAESYCGVPLIGTSGTVLGHLAIFDDKPMPDGDRIIAILRVFAARAGAELERLDTEAALRASETRYRDLYDGAPVAYLGYDTNGVLQQWNRRAEEMLGYSGAELRGKSFRDFAADTPHGKVLCEELFQKFLAGIETVSEVEGQRADGSPLWVHARVRPLRDANGAIVASQSILVDITPQKLAEVALRESEERYRHLYDDAPVAYLTFGPDACIRKVNRRCCEMFRMTPEELIGKTIFDLTADTAQGRQMLHAQFEEVLAGRDVFEDDELEGLRGDGSTFWIRVSSQVTRVTGEIVEVRTMGVDITDRKLAEATARRLERHNVYLEEEIRQSHGFDDIVGQSPALHALLQQVRLVAATDSTVLIGGETGTGKELIARAIHTASRRATCPFIKVNCAAIPAGLIESELFGHERGAFTGATERRTGRFELAHNGTIFLDEVGEMPLEAQVKLLRVLQEQELERVGGTKTITVDVRVIAATNRELVSEVAAGRFRQDLFYRLNVFPLTSPPLRARPGDVRLLVPYFVARYAAKIGRKISTVPAATMQQLAAYPWPGNVRELENVIERAVILSPDAELVIPSGILPAPATATAPDTDATAASVLPGATLDEAARAHIGAVLERTSWRIEGPSGAAHILGLHPNTLRSRMKKLGIRRG